jgi:hypothetical protein
VPTKEGEPFLSPSRTSMTVEGESSTKASTVARGHDLLQHNIKEGVASVEMSTIEPMVRHDDHNEKRGSRSVHGRGLGWTYLREWVGVERTSDLQF